MQCSYCAIVLADPPAAFCPNCGTATMAPSHYYSGPPPAAGLSGLGTATVVLLGASAVIQASFALIRLTGQDPTGINSLSVITLAATIPVFLTWFFRAYRNAGLWGPRRLGQGWSIGGWFVPVLWLWFPYRILADTWRASGPAGGPLRRPDAVANAWWACWLLTWIAAAHVTHTMSFAPDGAPREGTFLEVYYGGTTASNIAAAAAAVLGAVTVSRLTRMQEARRLG